MKAYHHSRDVFYRAPFGAVPCPQTVLLRLSLSAEAKQAYVISHKKNAMKDCGTLGDMRLFEGNLQITESGLAYYYFEAHTENGIVRIGCKPGYTGGESVVCPPQEQPTPWQITAYEPFDTPAWSKGAVFYQIFVDRFHAGNHAKNQLGIEYHRSKNRTIKMHPSWNDEVAYLPQEGEQEYLPHDFFGGDLEGVRQKLPYLKSLGVGAIYFNPIFEAPSNHKYDTADYKKIDPMFGDEITFKSLCEEAEEMGIRIILDGVFSHTGSDSIYFNKEKRYETQGAYNSQESPYYGWYTFMEFPDQYKSWWGFQTLPEVDEMRPAFLDYITGDNGVLHYWQSMGAGGWRLDVADELPEDFIRRLRTSVKKADEEAFVLGEVWEDASNKFSMGVKRRYCMGEELDSVMNYPWRNTLISFLLKKINAAECREKLLALCENYPKPFLYSLFNLSSSHDVCRVLTELCGAPSKESLTRRQQADIRYTGAELEQGKTLAKLFFLMLYALPGSPCIYYGDEAGLQGMGDPFNRRPYPWGKEDQGMVEWLRFLGKLRKEKVCRTGNYVIASIRETMIFLRFCDGKDAFDVPCGKELLLVAVNRGLHDRIIVDFKSLTEGPYIQGLELFEGWKLRELKTGQEFMIENAMLTMQLPPSGCLVLKGTENSLL
ncbi:MAG: glycoside hydrolase family 13 protein [Christensenellales bacterium]